MDEKNTKWVNEIPLKYKDMMENYKNIEMFQNIYEQKDSSSAKVQEGFKIFDDFDIHKKPKNAYNFKQLGVIFGLFNDIKEYLLCPFRKSDELIDQGIQNILNIFLEVNCLDLSLNAVADPNVEYTQDIQILDLSNVIQPDLLYKEEFQNQDETENIQEGYRGKKKKKKNTTTNTTTTTRTTTAAAATASATTTTSSKSGIVNDCKSQKEKAKRDVKRYSKVIRNEIYNILCIPIVIHILYNIYFMFFYRESGKPTEFIDIEKEYYDPYAKPLFSFFLDIIIKPLTYLHWLFTYIANHEKLHFYSDKYPYVFYIILYLYLYAYIASYGKNIITILGDLITMKTRPTIVMIFCLLIVVYEFFNTMKFETIDSWTPTLVANIVLGTVKYLIYWILRMCVTFILSRYSSLMCIVYIVYYFLFGIQISQSKDSFDVYSDIDNSIYEKIYKIFNSDCDPYNWFKVVLQFVAKFGFIYLAEITIFFVLYFGFYNYGAVDNANILSFLYILNFSGILTLFVWCYAKYKSFVKPLDEKYDLLNKDMKKQPIPSK